MEITSFIVALSVLGCFPPHAAPQKPVTTFTMDYVAPPDTMTELVQAVDVIVVGEVLESETVSYQTVAGGPPRVLTKHTDRIVELMKGSVGLRSTAGHITVLQPAGELDMGETILRANGGYGAFSKGEKYVLFLDWNTYLAAYDLAYGPSAIFSLKDGRIETPARVGPGSRSQGKLTTDFLAELRAVNK